MIDQVHFSSASKLIYLEVQLEKGPIYWKLHVYATKTRVDVVGLKVDPRPERILPAHVLEAKSQRSRSQ